MRTGESVLGEKLYTRVSAVSEKSKKQCKKEARRHVLQGSARSVRGVPEDGLSDRKAGGRRARLPQDRLLQMRPLPEDAISGQLCFS